MNDLNGILVVDKPAGWTSHDVVKKTRNLLGAKKVGHTGTLDPMATGVLVLLIGKATKASDRYIRDTKHYHAEITFGCATDTYDKTGKVTETGNPETINREVLLHRIKQFEGESEQIPPMFSAVKVGGKKLYRLARAGKTIERKSKPIFISRIEPDITDFPVITLDIICSKGTYIRSIAHQLGVSVGCPAHLSALRRMASGKFTLDDSIDFLSLVESCKSLEIDKLLKIVPSQDCQL